MIEADVVVHVVDASHVNVIQHIESVEDTLAEIDVPSVPRILVWNKMDLVGDELPSLQGFDDLDYQWVAQVSALKRRRLDSLVELIEEVVASSSYSVTLCFPYDRGDLVSYLYDAATVESVEHTADGVVVTAQVSPALFDRYQDYLI